MKLSDIARIAAYCATLHRKAMQLECMVRDALEKGVPLGEDFKEGLEELKRIWSGLMNSLYPFVRIVSPPTALGTTVVGEAILTDINRAEEIVGELEGFDRKKYEELIDLLDSISEHAVVMIDELGVILSDRERSIIDSVVMKLIMILVLILLPVSLYRGGK